MKRYLLFTLIGLDQLINVLLGGYPDETLSARAWRSREHKYWGVMHKIIDALFFWEEEHCKASYIAEKERRQFHKDYY